MRALGVLLFVSVGVLFGLDCGDNKAADGQICPPNQYFFCRCRDRQEGTKLCQDDGKSYGPCEPCQTSDNPEGPLEPGDPGPDVPVRPKDAGTDEAAPPPPKAVCGDSIVQDGEDCDDENDSGTDGCDHCKLAGETPGSSNSCGGLPVHVWGGDHKPTIVITTASGSPGNHVLAAECNGSKGKDAPDRVFQVVPHKSGKLRVTSTEAEFDTLLYVGTSCNPTTITAAACANAKAGTDGEVLTLDVQADKKYFVFIDGAATTANTGKTRITFSMP